MNYATKGLILLFFFSFIACKSDKTEKKDTVQKAACIDEVTRSITNPGTFNNASLATLLKECGSFVCNAEGESLLRLIEPIHNKPKVDYERIVKAFWKKNTPDYKEYTWKEIEDKFSTHCYDKYLAFNCDTTDISSAKEIQMDLIDDFTTNTTCYSITLFKSIKLKYPTITDTTKFKFTKAIVGTKSCVVFEVNDASIRIHETYDMSQDPTFVKEFLKEFLVTLNK